MKTFAALRNSIDEHLTAHLDGLENAQRVEALAWYCQGLGFGVESKTALGMAAALAPDGQQATRQRMQRALQKGRFSHTALFKRLQETVFESGRMQAYCLDDTGIAKKGDRSVGVQRQYSGTLGKVGNCQVIVSLHGVSDVFGACLGLQLYLPESWCSDAERLSAAGVPDDVEFKKKWQLGLQLLDQARSNGGPSLPVLADAGYGDSREFREGLTDRGLKYVVGVSSQTSVWRPGTQVAVPKRQGRRGPAPSRAEAIDGSQPVLLSQLAEEMVAAGQFKSVCWRMGTKGPLAADFAVARVRSAEGRTKGHPLPGEEQWLLVEREKTGDFKFYLSSMSPRSSLKAIVRLGKMRWHIERDYQDMKQELGFDKYEGRSWGGLHRHLAMVALMHAFVALHMEDFSPSPDTGWVDLE